MPNEAYLSTWKKYQAAWSPISAEERETLIRSCVSANCVYTDPSDECKGIEELIAKIERSQTQFPGASFENIKFLDHHDQGLSSWVMHSKEGVTIATGASFARFGPDGLLMQMTGFPELSNKKN